MFWRRSRPKEAAIEETDDLATLQKQFGIIPISDADVEADLLALSFISGGSSPTDEERLLLGIDNEDEDEEAKTLIELEMEGEPLLDNEMNSQQVAKKELCSILEGAHETARERSSRETVEMSGEGERSQTSATVLCEDEELQLLKIEAVALKRDGKIEQALAKFREAKQLQQKIAAEKDEASKVQIRPSQCEGLLLVENMLNDDVEVTDEDMRNPDFLAQLAEMDLKLDNGIRTDEKSAQHVGAREKMADLETRIHACKLQAVRLKREDRITDALACMRKIKELEANRDNLQSSQLLALVPPAVPRQEIINDTEPVEPTVSVNSSPNVRVNSDAATLDGIHRGSSNDSTDDADAISTHTNHTTCNMHVPLSEAEDASPIDPLQAERHVLQEAAVIRAAAANPRCLRNAPSIDENYLIDAFDDRRGCEAANHVTSVTSGNSFCSIPFVSGATSIDFLTEGARTMTSGAHTDDLPAQLQKTKQTALLLKRKGDIQGALEAIRRAKHIQNLIEQQASIVTASTMTVLVNQIYASRFQEIEQLLVDFGNKATSFAKGCLPANRNLASGWLSKRKRYEAELKKLRLKRQNPLQAPPLYEIVRSSHEVNFELPFVADDQIRVSIKSVSGLSRVAGKSVFVKFCLNFPSGTSHEGQTGEFRISSSASFSAKVFPSQKCFVFRLTRSRGTMRLFGIKKAVFEVWSPATLFRNQELVARAYQELSPLLTCCEIKTHIPFLGSNRRPCEGDIEIALQVRRPLKEKEVRLETVEDLVIDDYPEPSTRFTEHVPVPSLVSQPPPLANASSPIVKDLDQTTAQLQESQLSSASTSVDDPHHLGLIVSYDVINEELEKAREKLPSLLGPDAAALDDRCDSLALKKQILEIEMQTGTLTLDAYLERLRSRISADRILIAELLALNRRSDAARVFHRVKVMEKEMEGTEGASNDS